MTQSHPDTSCKTTYFIYNPDSERQPTDWRIYEGAPPAARMVQLHLDEDESAALEADIAQRGEGAVALDVLKRIQRDNATPSNG